MTPLRRIGCVRIPSFPIAVAVHAAAAAGDLDADAVPLALVTGTGSQARVQMANPVALAAGVLPGYHTAARARACVAELRILPWDDALYDRAHEDLAARLLECTPAVTRAGMGRFWLDASGQTWLGGEESLAERIRAAACDADYAEARVGIADTVVAAEAATHLAGPAAHRVPPDGDDAFLAPLPLSLLPLDPELLSVLCTMGLETVGELAALPASSLELRFGAEGLRAQNLARGHDPRGPLSCGGPTGRLVEVGLEPPAETLEGLIFAIRSALVTLLRTLKRQGTHVGRLQLHLHQEGGAPQRREVGLPRPTARLQPLTDLCRAALEQAALAAPVTVVGVEVIEKVPAAWGEQGDLFNARFRDPEALEAALSRIRARCGTDSVVRPVAVDSHRAEDQGRWLPDAVVQEEPPAPPEEPMPALQGVPESAASPALLPVARRVASSPVPVKMRFHDGTPAAIRLGGRWHTLHTAASPSRHSGQWWSRSAFARVDQVVTTREGARLTLSRPETGRKSSPREGWMLLCWED